MARSTRGSKKPKKPSDDHLITSLTVTQSPLKATEVEQDENFETHFDLIIDNFNSDTVEQLKKYSNVSSFEVHADNINCDVLLEALAVWKSQIISLEIHVSENRDFNLDDSLKEWKIFLDEVSKICTALQFFYVEDTNICHFVNANVADYLKFSHKYFSVPKKLKFKSLYFGLPMSNVQSFVTQLSSGQFKQLTKLAIFNLSDTVPFQLPQIAANNLTHYSTLQESFVESSTFRNLTFNSLTHLQLKTMLPLEEMLGLLDDSKLPNLRHLSIDNRANLINANSLGNPSRKRKTPEDERECVFVPVFKHLNSLEIYHPPHVALPKLLSQKSFPELVEVQLKISPNEPMFCCRYCQESANYAECHRVFYQSFKGWKNVEVVYNEKSVDINCR